MMMESGSLMMYIGSAMFSGNACCHIIPSSEWDRNCVEDLVLLYGVVVMCIGGNAGIYI
jgi:hypothetical protein